MAVLLFVGLIHGILYILIIPPWQHYEEPVHFEYSWLIAAQARLPEPDSYNEQIRREIAASMVENNFFSGTPNTNLLAKDPWIGISQTDDAPLYHSIVALPLSLLKYTSVELQLYTARAISLLMYLATIVASYAISRELTQEKNPLRWLIPLIISLTPAFTDLMTAINNDVGATLVFSIFLWSGIRMLLRGFSYTRAGLFVTLTVLSFFTKNTVLVALPLAILCFLFLALWIPKKWGRIFIPVSFAFVLMSLPLFFSIQDAAFWYRGQVSVQQDTPTRVNLNPARFGKSAIQIQFKPLENRNLNIFQPLTRENIAEVNGKSVTLGAWIWASEPVEIRAPYLWKDGDFDPLQIQITSEPVFYAFSEALPKEMERVQIVLNPLKAGFDRPVTIYYDGIVLTQGQFPGSEPPSFSDPKGEKGIWNGKSFVNLARNPTGDQRWLTFKPAILQSINSRPVISIYALPALQDSDLTSEIYQFTAKNLFESFWARFAWNQIWLPEGWYFGLAALTAVGILGTLWGLFTLWFKKPFYWKLATIWLMLAWALVWTAALARQNLPFWNTNIFVPSARYAYPAMIPTALILVGGWWMLSRSFKQTKLIWGLVLTFFLALDVYSIFTILRFYQ